MADGSKDRDMGIPDLIRTTRLSLGLMQKEIGEACGYEGYSAQVQAAKWEAGTRPVPLDKIRVLARTLKLEVDDLIP
jgi:transcriptional regulator with XRE-family HTH domain